MAVDISQFHLLNVADACAVWNVLSSRILYQATKSARCTFSCTRFVCYECLYKPRKNLSKKEAELQERLKGEQESGCFSEYHIDIEDLQDIEILERRQSLSKGELSSIVFAKRTRQAFLTDDQSARALAGQVMDTKRVQTTPHLLGWLFFSDFLNDSDRDPIIKEHREFDRPLAKYFEETYLKALETKLAKRFS